ncbi:MAG: 4-hydroxy-tetrahydrodipicolinate synthase [Actinomycetia bacterium]|nr:4-hydroxy-tetrahydrodipicolinate synthase [Actinomycetes bacterium]
MPTTSPFGRIISAMVSPMRPNGSVDLDAAQELATWLADQGHDGLVINGTTGESPTTTDREKADLVRAVLDAVGDRVTVTAGVGTNVTSHTVELARQAELCGAHALLVVTPYYNKPPQAGLVAHFTEVADSCQLPILVYDIPGRSGVPLSKDTLRTLAEHPNIQGVKDAKADFWQASALMQETDLLWFSGDDAANLLHFANGAHGFVGVTSQVAPRVYAQMAAHAQAGNLAGVRDCHRRLMPLVEAVMNQTQGAIAAKAALAYLGRIPDAHVRLPLVPATEAEIAAITAALDALGEPTA